MLPPVATRRAKMVCTIGPASDSLEALSELLLAGMNVARLNFSHGTHEEHGERIRRVRQAAENVGKTVAVLQDLCGPKIRCGTFASAPTLGAGDTVELVEGKTCSTEGVIPIQYAGLADDLHPGDQILLDDGRIEMKISKCAEGKVFAEVLQGGALRDRVGVHLPAERVRIESLTEKDKRDLAFGLSQQVDYVALSFVRSAQEVQRVRDICEAWGQPKPIVSKIETPQAIKHLESIVLASDAVMVARGDLGVEFSPERVPVMQRRILSVARRHQRPVIVATEMMQSMTTSSRPTRAEASDVATAIFDGADAVMLSGETAMGKHPALVVRTMHRIMLAAEESPFHVLTSSPQLGGPNRVSEAIARGASDIATAVGAKVIVAFTESGRSAKFVSGARPSMPIIGMSPNDATERQLCLLWGVVPMHIGTNRDSDKMINHAQALLLSRGVVSPGDTFVVIFGAPVGVSGSTNAIQVRTVE